MNAPALQHAPAAGWAKVDIHELAAAIADEASATLIGCECKHVTSGDKEWFDLHTCDIGSWHWVDKAVTYLERRGEASSHRLVRCKAFPSLVQVEERG